MIIELIENRVAFLINSICQVFSIIIIIYYSTNTYISYKIKQAKLNIEWGLDNLETQPALIERVQYIGKPVKNLVNGFVDHETELNFL